MGIAHYLKEIGRGHAGARALSRAQASDLMGQILDDQVSDLEVGGFCLAMRIKGETPEEMAGFLDAVETRLTRLPSPSEQVTVVLPSYNGARKLPVLTPLLALLLAREGLPVVVHGTPTESSRVLSQDVFHALGIVLGHVVYACSARYRRIFLANLQQAGFNQSALRRQAIAEAGKAVMELIPVWFRPQSAVATLVQDVSLMALVARARARGKGVIFITPHMGCFEVAAQWYAQRHGPLTVLYSPPRRGLFSRLVTSGRAKPQLHLATPDLRGAAAIVARRNEKGAFRSRADLREVPRLGPKAFEQAAGFLRIRDVAHPDRKSTRLNSSHVKRSRMPSSA